jgi:hypothetical protein
MGRTIDYTVAGKTLAEEFDLAEQAFREGKEIAVPSDVAEATSGVFRSRTQAYREALVGCALARILDPKIDIRLPYMNQGDDAFNARTLDERVVNPFLKDHSIPSSKNPYLSALRRNVRFVAETLGQKDQQAYRAFLDFIGELECVSRAKARKYLRYLLVAFIGLRDAADIPLARVQRLSIEQYETLISGLLTVPSGGRLPVLLAVATFKTINECFALDWTIEWQGINVADRAKGVAGDISVSREHSLMFSVEVTERPLDRARVVSTFTSKIAPGGIDDYIFFFTASEPNDAARNAARQYFAQGHDINFVQITDWIMTILRTIGTDCRRMFTQTFIELLNGSDVPATLKVAWNDHIRNLLSV